MKLNKQGFGAVEALIILIVITLVAFVGFRIIDSNNDDDSASVQNVVDDGGEQKQEPKEVATNDEEAQQQVVPPQYDTSSWTNVSVNTSFNFKYPADEFTSLIKYTNQNWVYARLEDPNTDIEFDATDAQVVEQECLGFSDVVIFSIQVPQKGETVAPPVEGDATAFTIDGVEGTKVCTKGVASNFGVTVNKYCEYRASIENKEVFAYFQIVNDASTLNVEERIDAVMRTIDFTL